MGSWKATIASAIHSQQANAGPGYLLRRSRLNEKSNLKMRRLSRWSLARLHQRSSLLHHAAAFAIGGVVLHRPGDSD